MEIFKQNRSQIDGPKSQSTNYQRFLVELASKSTVNVTGEEKWQQATDIFFKAEIEQPN